MFSAGKEQVVLLWDRCLSHFGNYVGYTNFFVFLLLLDIHVEGAAAMLLYYTRMNYRRYVSTEILEAYINWH